MDVSAVLDELARSLLVGSRSRTESARRVAIVARWAQEQSAELATTNRIVVDFDRIVADVQAEWAQATQCECGPENYFGPCPRTDRNGAPETTGARVLEVRS